MFKLPMIMHKRGNGEEVEALLDHPMLSPCDFVNYMYNHHPDEFARRFFGRQTWVDPAIPLREWWDKIPKNVLKYISCTLL